MSDGLEKDQDSLDSNWLTHWETKCIDEWENENDTLSVVEERINRERELASQRLWLSFQGSASAISLLYKEGGPKQGVWVPFQNAATSVTTLYKDGMDVMKKCFEMGKQYGQHRRNDELIAWTKNSRRHIRREELLGYLCGKSPPQFHHAPRHHHRSNGVHGGRVNSHRHSGDRSSPRHSSPRVPSSRSGSSVDPNCGDMHCFCEALALQGLNGAMSNIGIRNNPNAPPSSNDSAANGGASDDQFSFVLEEVARRKRGANSPSRDNVLDSPTRKRSRLL